MKSTEAYVQCSQFMGSLLPLGLRQDGLRPVEEAYWMFLIDREPSEWDNDTPFNGARVDIEKCGRALAKMTAPLAVLGDAVYDAFFSLAMIANREISANGVDDATARALRSESLGQFLRFAAFIALARGYGVFEAKQRDLEVLVAQETTRAARENE